MDSLIARLSSRYACLSMAVCLWMHAANSSFAAEQTGAALPLKKVVLFSSGVGFFEHSGKIEGNAKVELKFNIEDINDLLKSMVLQDLGGGRISTVTYGSKDPITKTLKTFAIDLTQETTIADLLRQVRGEKVQIDAPTAVTGVILGVETRKTNVGKDETVSADVLNLVTATGLRGVPLDSVREIRLVDERLNSELQQALAILAMGHSTDKKSVTLNFFGNGARPVRVGYIQESPLWKTSYRLVLDDDEAPFLQGWAIVENTSEQDWDEVSLTLVSGRPISFIMDLYEPLYVGRPLVEPELFASLRPQTYNQDLAEQEQRFRAAAEGQVRAEAGPGRKRPQFSGGMGGGGGGFFGGSSPKVISVVPVTEPMDLTKGVKSTAQTDDVGELFRYAIATPVSLPRQQSAMLPIVNESIKGEKVSIYNADVHSKHPLNGLKFTNSTDLHLMQGPITLFDEGTYAGDAQILDLPPGGKRLISYALDLDTEVVTESKVQPDQLVEMRITPSTVFTTHRCTREQSYLIKNSGGKAKKVLLEQPAVAAWKVMTPEPTEKTRDLYRFATSAEPGKPATIIVREEQIVHHQTPMANRLVDLDLEVVTRSGDSLLPQETDETLVGASISKGLLHESRQRTRRYQITVRNSGPKAHAVTVEYPIEAEWKLVGRQEPTEKTAELYRFVLNVEPGKLSTLTVEEQRLVNRDLGLADMDDKSLGQYFTAKGLSAEVKAALGDILKRKAALAKLLGEFQEGEKQVRIVDQEQSRIRQNMAQLERDSDLYKRYVKKFGEQEDQIDKLRKQLLELSTDAGRQRQALDDFMAGISVP